MSTATRTAGVGAAVGDEVGKNNAWLAIGDAVVGSGGGGGGDRLLVKGRMNREGRDERSTEFSVEPVTGP